MRKSTLIASLVLILSVVYSVKTKADSTVYLFVPSVGNMYNGTLEINGDVVIPFQGSVKKEVKAPGWYPMKFYNAYKKKLTFKQEGKIVLRFTSDKFDAKTGTTAQKYWMAEIQFNLSEGSVHYAKLAPKGFSNCQFKIITEKEAEKMIKDNKKYESLTEYVEK